jgi:hypothetical protein
MWFERVWSEEEKKEKPQIRLNCDFRSIGSSTGRHEMIKKVVFNERSDAIEHEVTKTRREKVGEFKKKWLVAKGCETENRVWSKNDGK